MKQGIIYKITNKVNGKVYIGKTTQKFNKRVRRGNYKSCKALDNAIKSHGWDNFTKEEFICSLDVNNLAKLEEMTIKHFDCLAPKGYNLISIDNGLNVMSPEMRKKQSDGRRKFLATLTEPLVAVNKKDHVIVDGVPHKSCNKCEQFFTLDMFNKRSAHWDNLDKYCKPCSRILRYRPYVGKTQEEIDQSYIDRNKKMRAGVIANYVNNPETKTKISKATSKPIVGTNIETGEQIEFESALKAKDYGFDNANIGRAIKNGKPYKQHTWKFK